VASIVHQCPRTSAFSLGHINGFSSSVRVVKCSYKPIYSLDKYFRCICDCSPMRWNVLPPSIMLILLLNFSNDLISKPEDNTSEFTLYLPLGHQESLQQRKTHFPKLHGVLTIRKSFSFFKLTLPSSTESK